MALNAAIGINSVGEQMAVPAPDDHFTGSAECTLARSDEDPHEHG